MRSTLAKQDRPRNHPAAHAHRGAPRAVATSHASTPAITKHCATVSGSGIFANQICGIEIGDLAGHELQPAARRLVVEEDAGDGEQVVALAVVHRNVVGEDLRDAVGAARIERRQLGLRRLADLAEPNISLDDAW